MNYITVMTNENNEIQRSLKRVLKEFDGSIYFKVLNCIDMEEISFKNIKYDLIFLDIDQDGIQKAQSLRSKGYTQAIIFYASSQKEAYQCYTLHPFDYLLKPLNDENLKDVINQYLIFCYKYQKKVIINDSRGHPKYRLSIDKIEYIESSNTKLLIHLVNKKTIHMYAKLNDIEKEINDPQFLRCHQSYLVNMQYVKDMNDVFEMASQSIVPIRVRNKHQIKQQFIQYDLDNT